MKTSTFGTMLATRKGRVRRNSLEKRVSFRLKSGRANLGTNSWSLNSDPMDVCAMPTTPTTKTMSFGCGACLEY